MTSIQIALRDAQLDKIDAEILLAHVMQQDRTYLYTWSDKILNAEQQTQFDDLCQQRLAGQPIAYITGTREFWSLPIQVNEHVLIPRPETELLVELAIKIAKPEQVIVDLGTGSGAIACALASELPNNKVIAVDVSKEALNVAQQNANNLNFNIEFKQSSWCDGLADQSIDMIISNPPYIEQNDPHLTQGDVRFEPSSALASGEDGLDDIRLITEQAKRVLVPGGLLAFEHGYDQAAAVAEIMNQQGLSAIGHHKDLQGIKRVTEGQNPQH